MSSDQTGAAEAFWEPHYVARPLGPGGEPGDTIL